MGHGLLKEYEPDAAGRAIPVFFVGADALENAGLPEDLLTLARVNNFNGEPGALLAGETGVLLGVGDGADRLILAAAAYRLPAGEYKIAGNPKGGEAELMAFAWALGGYRFDRYKEQKPAEASLIAPEGVDIAQAARASDGVFLVRDLVNTPAADLTPAALEESAKKIANDFGAKINVVTGADLLSKNFPMVHAVGRAAKAEPRLIDFTWGRAKDPKVTIVGKGVCFDSGGLNIKGAAGMALMKKDMGGAAHTLALAQMIMSAKLKLRLRVIIPAVENAISGDAYRPGDILNSRKGLTVEIGNTDAEGRLILADGLAFAGEENPDCLISLATLTGAARVALGPELAPFYCDDDDFACQLSDSAAQIADPVWRMPLWRNYEAMLQSQVADINHITGGTFAGSVTAALFLSKFVPGDALWAHFDLYAWRPKAAPGRPAGGEAQAIRALFDLLSRRYPA